MLLNAFNGGLSKRLDPSLIARNEAVELTNVDVSKGVLTPVKGLVEVEPEQVQQKYFYKYEEDFVSSDNYRDYLLYRNILYYTEPARRPKKYGLDHAFVDDLVLLEDTEFVLHGSIELFEGVDIIFGEGSSLLIDGDNEYNMGIDRPLGELDISLEVYDFSDLNYSFAQTGLGDFLVGSYDYKFVFTDDVNNVYEIEDSFSITTDNSQIQITIKEFSGVNLKVFRDFGGTFYLVKQVTLDKSLIVVDKKLDVSLNEEFVAVATVQGVLQYTVTYYNSDDGTESAPMELTDEINVESGNKVTVSNVPVSSDKQVNQRRIYRLGGTLTDFFLIKTIDNNVDTEFIDYTVDINAEDLLTSSDNLPPDSGMLYLVENYGIFFGAVGTKMVFSSVLNNNYWPVSNFIEFNADITGLRPFPGGIIVFTEFKTFLISGTNADEFVKSLVSDTQGCILHKSIDSVKSILLWASHDGICTLNNGNVVVVSKNKLGKLVLDPVNSRVFDEVYYLLLSDGRFFAFDVRFEPLFYYLDFSVEVQNIGVFDNIFYALDNEYKLTKVFEGDFLTFKYRSPVLTEGQHTLQKIYNNVYIRYEGIITVRITANSEEVYNRDLSEYLVEDAKLNIEEQRFYFLQIEIEGTGTVYEMEFKVLPRQNER